MSGPISTDFAGIDDLALYWRKMSTAEDARAGTLLALASVFIRQEKPSVDADVQSGALSAELPKWVAMDIVKNAMMAGKHEGKSQYARSVGPFVDSATLVNPAGTLVLTAAHLKAIGVGAATAPVWNFGDC